MTLQKTIEKSDEETNIKFLIEEMEKDAEEYGQLHNEDCGIYSDENYPDACDCKNMKVMKSFALEWMVKVNKKWIEMSKAHRAYKEELRGEIKKMKVPPKEMQHDGKGQCDFERNLTINKVLDLIK